MLKETFRNYIKVVQEKLPKKSQEDRKAKGLHLLINEPMELNTLVSKLEEQYEFINLLGETRTIFDSRKDLILFLVQISASPLMGNPLNPFDLTYLSDDYTDDMWWKIATHNFFCRSGFYNDSFAGRTVDFDKLFLTFCNAFQEERFKTKYLVPLGHVRFSESFMSFDKFSIRTFNHEELDTIIQNRVNFVFYKYAFSNTKDIEDYWFICFEDIKNVSEERDRAIGGEGGEEYSYNDYGLYPKKAEFILKCLSLYPWEEKSLIIRTDFERLLNQLLEETNKEKYVEEYKEEVAEKINRNIYMIDSEEYTSTHYKFSLPFVIEVQESLICFPPVPPNSYEGSISEIQVIDLHDIETEQFKTSIKKNIVLIEKAAKGQELEFTDNAIRFLFKAFFSKGIDGLLWNITAIESLIGEKDETKRGVTEILAEGISEILGDTEHERLKLWRRFKKLGSAGT